MVIPIHVFFFSIHVFSKLTQIREDVHSTLIQKILKKYVLTGVYNRAGLMTHFSSLTENYLAMA